MTDAPTDVNIREWVVDELKPLVPKNWVLIGYGVAPETITKPTIVLTLQTVVPNPGNPQGTRLVSYTLTLLEPVVGNSAASALDDKLVDFLTAIEGNKHFVWSKCERGAVGNYTGWDITLDIPINKTP
jgi:hypothetical protein